MQLKELPRKVSCVTSDLKLDCSIVQNRIHDIVLEACGFTDATPQRQELNVQVVLAMTRLITATITRDINAMTICRCY